MTFAVVAALALAAVAFQPDRYVVRAEDTASRLIRVEADLHVRDSVLTMRRSVWSEHLEDGWATWVDAVEARSEGGSWHVLPYLGGASWDTSSLLGRRIQLRYAVRLEHERARWPYGRKESTWVRDGMIHAVGMSLFVFGSSLAGFEVELEVPAAWSVLVPWEPVPGADRTFAGSGPWQLVHSVMALGRLDVASFDVGSARVRVATGPGVGPAAGLLTGTLSPLIREATAAFGRSPAGDLTVLVTRGETVGGAAFHRGFTMTVRGPPEPDQAAWQRTLAHELVHRWIGSDGIRTAGPEGEWFKEGFTAYYTALLLARAGALDADGFMGELYRLVRMHRRGRGPALPAAGAEELGWYDRLYGGGAMLALCLDVRLRLESGGTRSLDDVVASLYRTLAPSGRPFDLDVLSRELEARSDPAVDRWTRRMLEGPEDIPVEWALERLGLEEAGWPWRRRLRRARERGPRGALFEALVKPASRAPRTGAM